MTPDNPRKREIRAGLLGLAGTLILTCAAFAAVRWQFASAAETLAMVFALGLLQIVLHFRSFLHVSLRQSSRDNLHLILFSALIILLMVGGTLVILANQHQRMM